MHACKRRDFIRHLGFGITAATLPRWLKAEVQAESKPNVVFWLTDDMGWADPSCYGNKYVKTPNIDRLAAEGVRFTRFYCASPICSPSRVGFTTGMYPARWNITTFLHDRKGNAKSECADFLDLKAPTLAKALKQAGYATAHIGKWHMGGGRDVDDAPWPTAYGFDESWTTWEGLGPGIDSDADCKGKINKYDRTAKFVDKTIDFIKRNKGKPFYVNVWTNETHDKHIPDPAFLPKYRGSSKKGEADFNAVLDKFDKQFGRLMDFLGAEGLASNTIVAFASDNGPNPPFEEHRRTGGLRGMKWSLYEGGIRMPFIVRWPGKIPAGKTDETTVTGAVDLLPTICALAGVAAPVDFKLDGEDMSAAWCGKTHQRKNPLFWEYGRNPTFLRPKVYGDKSPNVAIRSGKWKLLVNADGTGPELYNIENDPMETNNLATKNPEISDNLSKQALAWGQSLPKLKN